MSTDAEPAAEKTRAEQAPEPKRKVSDRTQSERRLAWMLCAPAVIAMLLVTAYPIGYALVLSLQEVDLRFPGEGGFVGFDNYATVLGADLWWKSVFNTALITIVSVAIELVLGMIIALVMFRAIFGRALVRTSVLIPYGIITVVAAFAWFYAFDPASGFVNGLPIVADDKAWFGDRWTAMAVIFAAEIWKTTPFIALLLLAGMTTIDEGLYEAAKVDGASAWQRFRSITIPMLAPTMLFVSLITMIGYFQLFAEPYVMTQGGPLKSTLSVVLLMYEEGFRWWNMGSAAAIAFVLFAIILVATLVQLRFQKEART